MLPFIGSVMGNGKSHGPMASETQVTSPAWPLLRCLELQKLMIVDIGLSRNIYPYVLGKL